MPEKKKTTKSAKTKEVKTKEKKSSKSNEYIQTLGRRKTSVAQVRMYKNGKGKITINNKELEKYLPQSDLQQIVKEPLVAAGQEGQFDFTVKVEGGGIRGQAESIRLGIARALVVMNPALKKSLKKPGYLTRDPRKKERKKPGLKGARRAPQWSKR